MYKECTINLECVVFDLERPHAVVMHCDVTQLPRHDYDRTTPLRGFLLVTPMNRKMRTCYISPLLLE